MDPLLDEKIVHILSRNLPEVLDEEIQTHAWREAYGPSRNEGLCHESVVGIDFFGPVEGQVYFCMEGYTRLKVLPALAEWGRKRPGEMINADELVSDFAYQVISDSLGELEEAGIPLRFATPQVLNRKLVPIDNRVYRQYMIIFFLRNTGDKKYTGRLTIILTIKKFTDDGSEPDDEPSEGP